MKPILCLGYIYHGRRTIYLSTIFPTILSASQAAISYDVCVYIAYDHLTISFGDKLVQIVTDLADIVRQQQGYRTIIVLSSQPPCINRTMPVR